MNKYLCAYPWTHLSLAYNGHVRPQCCYYEGFVDVFQDNVDIASVWNGQGMRNLREALVKGEFERTGCRDCAEKYSDAPFSFELSPVLTARQQENAAACHTAYRNGSPISGKMPLHMALNFSPACNIRCIMCSQEELRIFGGQEKLFCDMLQGQFKAFENVHVVNITGGEPLYSSECTQFIKHMCTNDSLLPVRLEITSNGTLLGNVLEVLSLRDNLHLAISVDGLDETFESVRRGAKFSAVQENVDSYLTLRAKLGKTRWDMTVGTVLMKTTIPSLPALARWCVARHLKVGFMELIQTRETSREDVLQDRSLLLEIPGWEENISEAAAIFKQAGMFVSGVTLERYLQKLTKPVQHIETKFPIWKDGGLRKALSSDIWDAKRVVVWGTGSYYRYNLAEWMETNRERFQFLGFVDNNEAIWGAEKDGFPVFAPTELVNMQPDIIVLGLQSCWRNKVVEQLENMNLKEIFVV